MAINFPNSPSVGNTYDYLGVRYTWFEPSPGLGLWKATTPGSVGIASAAEITAGTDTIKYITPASIKDAQLWQQGTHVGASAAELDKMDGCGASTTEFNKLIGLTAAAADLNKTSLNLMSIVKGITYNIGVASQVWTSSFAQKFEVDTLIDAEVGDILVVMLRVSCTKGATGGHIKTNIEIGATGTANLKLFNNYSSGSNSVHLGASQSMDHSVFFMAPISGAGRLKYGHRAASYGSNTTASSNMQSTYMLLRPKP